MSLQCPPRTPDPVTCRHHSQSHLDSAFSSSQSLCTLFSLQGESDSLLCPDILQDPSLWPCPQEDVSSEIKTSCWQSHGWRTSGGQFWGEEGTEWPAVVILSGWFLVIPRSSHASPCQTHIFESPDSQGWGSVVGYIVTNNTKAKGQPVSSCMWGCRILEFFPIFPRFIPRFISLCLFLLL